MGIMDLVRTRLTPDILSPRVTNVGASWDEWWQEITSDIPNSTPAKLFRTQPHLYTVCSFLARNVAQIGLHSFVRDGELDRRRDRTSVLARTLANVDGQMTSYELIYSLVGDLCLYDRAFWFVAQDETMPSGWIIRRLPPSWVTPKDATPFEVKTWTVATGGKSIVMDASQILTFTGYSPTDPLCGSPAVNALRDTLAEQVEAALYRRQVWKRGGRASSVLQRPANAPKWSDAARDRFRDDWYSKFTGSGTRAGGTPILEDGMTLQRIDFNAQQQQFVEAARLSMTTVASAFHVNPTMIGQNEGANYANVREFRRMLYGDTLGPLLAQIEARINARLIPMLGLDPDVHYTEFNIAEKLQGSFEEQAIVMSTLVGRPIMTANEGRARFNLPQVAEGEGLTVPLNVLIGGQASPQDSGSQNVGKSVLPESLVEHVKASALSKLGAGDPGWWDAERWLSEAMAEVGDRMTAEGALKALHDEMTSDHAALVARLPRRGDDFQDSRS